MKRDVKHVLRWVLMIIVLAGALGGCGEFRRQAADAQARLDDAVENAQVAEDAAARNTARIGELNDRVDALEAVVNELRSAMSERVEDSTQTNDE